MGSLHKNYLGWVGEGRKTSAAKTRKWKSAMGEVLVRSVSDKDELLIIDKIVPGPLAPLPCH